VGILTLAYLPLIVQLSQLHPYEGVYYNLLTGGVRGAAGRYPQEYWGSSFRAGCDWVNENLPQDAVVLTRVGGRPARYYLRAEARRIADEDLPHLPPDQIVYVMYITRVDKYGPITAFTDAHLTPIHTIAVEGVPLLKIVRTDAGTLAQSVVN
jgi:hypothetical protein